MKKTFNIGEESYYGRWKIEIGKEAILVTGMDWDTRRIERQDSFTFADIPNGRLENHLWEMSTSYYASTMMEWVNEKVPPREIKSLW